MPTTVPDSRALLRAQLQRTGYYPELVMDVLDSALAGEALNAHLVQAETTFAGPHVHRHLTVLALTPTRLISAHVDDQPADEDHPIPSAAATTEVLRLSTIRSVAVTQVIARPAEHRSGDLPAEVTLAIGWGSVTHIELEPAACPDPHCDADHGLTGAMTPDDLIIRISAQAEGERAVRDALAFASVLSAVTGAAAI